LRYYAFCYADASCRADVIIQRYAAIARYEKASIEFRRFDAAIAIAAARCLPGASRCCHDIIDARYAAIALRCCHTLFSR